MSKRNKLITGLDSADLFLRNRAKAKPTPLNEYDIEALLDIAKICDEAARLLEKAIIAPCNVSPHIEYFINQFIVITFSILSQYPP
mgnify:CR=1 FL=1